MGRTPNSARYTLGLIATLTPKAFCKASHVFISSASSVSPIPVSDTSRITRNDSAILSARARFTWSAVPLALKLAAKKNKRACHYILRHLGPDAARFASILNRKLRFTWLAGFLFGCVVRRHGVLLPRAYRNGCYAMACSQQAIT